MSESEEKQRDSANALHQQLLESQEVAKELASELSLARTHVESLQKQAKELSDLLRIKSEKVAELERRKLLNDLWWLACDYAIAIWAGITWKLKGR